MIMKCIKVPFNEEITGKAGASVQFVEKTTIPLDTTVKDAIDSLHVMGQPQLVKNNFLGLMKSIAEGVQRDGKPRKIADFLRVYPVFTGAVDLQAGVKNKYYSMRSMLSNGLDSLYVTPDIKLMRSDYLSAFLRGMVYTFDRNYYPESGLDVDFGHINQVLQLVQHVYKILVARNPFRHRNAFPFSCI